MFFCHTHKQFHLSHVIQIAVTQANFTQTSVTDPSVSQSNSMPTKFLLSAPIEVFTSIIIII